MTEFKTVSSEELLKLAENENITILDLRSADSYNGWRLHNEKRAGHIKQARCFPFKWFQLDNWPEIAESKGMKTLDPVILYSNEQSDLEDAALKLRKQNYKKVYIYRKFIEEWSADENYPMEHLKRYEHLVPPSWLNNLISSSNANREHDKKVVLCHCHYRNPDDYKMGHIHSAVELDTNRLENPDTWNIRSPLELRNVLEDLGIKNNTTVIVYGRFSSPDNEDPFPGSKAGHLGAFRAGLIMMYAGIEDVRILNGGLQSWISKGYDITTKDYAFERVDEFGAEIPVNPGIVIDTEQAKDYIADKNRNLISVRSWNEYIGKVSGYHYIDKKGRIPGAVFGNGGSDAYHMENYRNPDHTVREYHEIEYMLKKAGITPDKYNAFYCGTGWRASEAFWDVWLMGWSNISIYDGGWYEWSSDASNPVQSGVVKNKETAL